MSLEGYDHDRRNQTWHEVHGWSKREKSKRRKVSRERRHNRDAGRFGKVNWNAYHHEQLYDMIMSADPGAMYARAGQWQTLAAKIEATTGQVQQAMERVMGAWQGQAAVSSAESNTRLMTWAGDASQTANKVAAGMATYSETVEWARNAMPEPAFASAERNFRHGYTVTGTGGASTAVLLKELTTDGMVSFEEARARQAKAVQVMETYEAQSKDVHDGMPHFTDAASTTSDVPDRPAGQPGPDSTPQPHPAPTQPGQGSGVGAGGLGSGSSTTAAGFVPPGIGGSGGPGGAGYGGGPGGTGFGGGLPGGLGSLGSGGSEVIRNTPGFGGLAGVGGVPAGRGAFGAGVAGARGAGMGAFGGMPVGSAQGDEDKEHKNKYDPGMDFLDDLPPAYPPVFGA